MRVWRKLAGAAFLLNGAAALAWSDPAPLTGRWTGEVNEPGTQPSRYSIQVNMVFDRTGAAVATVRYGTLNCAGVWLRPTSVGGNWRLEEVITDDPAARCMAQADVELTPANGGLTARWFEPESDVVVATAVLRGSR